MASPDDQTLAAAEEVRSASHRGRFDAAVVMGSGWAVLADTLGQTSGDLVVGDLPGFITPTAEGHLPQVRCITTPASRSTLVFLGRTHLYQEHGSASTVRAVDLAAALGADQIVLTNASGGVNPALAVGDAVLLTDHLNLTGHSPLTGADFVDLGDCYSRQLRETSLTARPDLHEGVYAMLRGPQYETAAENRYLRAAGADIVGMSTVLEAIKARSLGMAVCALSIVSASAPGSNHPIAHDDVLAVAGREAAALAPVAVAVLEA